MKTQSFFLFGPRGSGKSTFVLKQFLKSVSGPVAVIDLLQSEVEESYRADPSRLERFSEEVEWIFIDEVQKLPHLLDHVHRLIEARKHKFVLSGSSSRKLKRGGANLLAGRAFVEHLFPLTREEAQAAFDLEQVLYWGSLPEVFAIESDAEKESYLRSYVQTYLREEILVEQLVRKVDPFRDFLEVAAQMNGKIISYAKIGKEVGVDAKTVETYFQILEDTYIGFRLPGFHRSIRKSQTVHPKFFLFDLGVKRALERTLKDRFSESTTAFGNAFEHLVVCEAFRLNHYLKQDFRFAYLRTKDDAEVDLVLSRGRKVILIEIKSYTRVDKKDIVALAAFQKSLPGSVALLLSRDPQEQVFGAVKCLPWEKGLDAVFHV